MSKVVTIVGARPQFVKASALSRALMKEGIQEVIIHTGQHFDDNMADIFFRQMEIPKPGYNLEIHSLPHGAMTGRMLEEIEKVLLIEKPSVIVVYGDTNSTLAGALAASKLHIPVAHIEAGLRSFNMKMPEEINRILTDRISGFLFCPTQTAIDNLKKEGFGQFEAKVVLSGDVMYDVALHYSKISAQKSTIISHLQLEKKPFILATLHRQENTDDPTRLQAILEALNHLSDRFRIVLPIHPRTRKVLEGQNISLNFSPIDPVGYFDMLELLKHCSLVVTDSGGLQKEAFFFEKHCVVVRDETEWTELVELGFNFVVGADKSLIISKSLEAIQANRPFDAKPYGEGKAAEIIAKFLKKSYKMIPDMENYFSHPTAVIDQGAQIGKGTKIWHFCHVSSRSVLGENCVLGQNVYVADDVVLGNNVKVQNNVSIYTGVTCEDDVFLGPSMVFTNVINPRSSVNRKSEYMPTLVKKGATIGANSTIVCGVTLGKHCFIGAGAVVTRNVPDYALVVGNPARQTGWMSGTGEKLHFDKDMKAVCPSSGDKYYMENGRVHKGDKPKGIWV